MMLGARAPRLLPYLMAGNAGTTAYAPAAGPGPLTATDPMQPSLSATLDQSLPNASTSPINLPLTMPATPEPQRAASLYDAPSKTQMIAGILGDALAGMAGSSPQFAPMMERRRQEQSAFERGEQQYQRRRADELADAEREAKKPQFFSSGNDRLSYDPVTGQTTTIYHGLTDAENYAQALGLAKDAPGYSDAIRDYVLRANGPTANDQRIMLEHMRDISRQQQLERRLAVQRRGQSIASADRRRGQDVTDKRARDLHGRKVGGKPVTSDEGIIQMPDGRRGVVRNGAWVDAVTGKPL